MAGDAVYVYGIIPANERAAVSVTGVADRRVRFIEHGPVAALASDFDDDALAAAREVRRHWRVLEEASKATTVLPVRFGTLMESDDAVRELLLEPHTERLEALLRELDGRVQLNLKGGYDEERLLRDVVTGSPAISRLRERVRILPEAAGYYERIQLGELIAAEVARRREQDTSVALAMLQPLAIAARAEEPRRPDAAFDLAFLVERDGIDAFSQAVGALDEKVGERIQLRYVGPLPPYSFAQDELAVGADPWA
jgi:hypothetical protein